MLVGFKKLLVGFKICGKYERKSITFFGLVGLKNSWVLKFIKKFDNKYWLVSKKFWSVSKIWAKY